MQKKILILGGTMFAGRALVERLMNDNRYVLTLFNRGKSNSGIFPSVTQMHGNRETDDILQVCDQHWDIVIDFSGYYPKTFSQLLDRMSDKVGRYIFISTISVFPFGEGDVQHIGEDDATLSCAEEQMISPLPDAYGEKKAEMERILLTHPELDPLILRPSFIYGRYDWTDRFYYWLYRAKQQQKYLLPEPKLLSLTYVEDLVNGILSAIEVKQHLPFYNAITHTNVRLDKVMEFVATHQNRTIELSLLPKLCLKSTHLRGTNFLWLYLSIFM
jgi:2'-hydroxyisoflavone reductase